MGKYFKSLDYTVRIPIPYGYIPITTGEDKMYVADAAKIRTKQEMHWRKMIKKAMNLDRQHIITVDITAKRANCAIYAMGLTKQEKARWGQICESIIKDKNNVIEW